MEQTNKQSGRIIAIIAMMFIYAMISFVTNLARNMEESARTDGQQHIRHDGKHDELPCIPVYGYTCRQAAYQDRL